MNSQTLPNPPQPNAPRFVQPVVGTARHSLLDDVQGQLFGIVMTAFGASILKAAGLITGQLAGLSLLLAHVSDWSFGSWLFLVNLPFYIFGFKRMGWQFTLKTLISVAGTAVLADLLPHLVSYSYLDPVAAAVLGGFCSGIGLIALFRHGCSCGGIGTMSLYLQDAIGFRAGWTQLIFDVALFVAAMFVLNTKAMVLSLLGAVVMNLVIAINHRRDRYLGS